MGKALKAYPAVQKELKAFPFLWTDANLSRTDLARINDMASLMTDPERTAKYPTWEARAALLGIPLEKVTFYRRTVPYQNALKAACKLRAMESASQALGAMEAQANEGNTQAFDRLLQVAEMKGSQPVPTTQITNNTVNVSYEQRLMGLLEAKVGPVVTVEAQEVSPAPERGSKGEP